LDLRKKSEEGDIRNNICCGDEISKDGVGRACSTHRKDESVKGNSMRT
jgi:hypothetical protein